jgi:hypothetical protein
VVKGLCFSGVFNVRSGDLTFAKVLSGQPTKLHHLMKLMAKLCFLGRVPLSERALNQAENIVHMQEVLLHEHSRSGSQFAGRQFHGCCRCQEHRSRLQVARR